MSVIVNNKNYVKVHFLEGKTVTNNDLNTLQDIQYHISSNMNKYGVGDGPNGESWKVLPHPSDSYKLLIKKGLFIHLGEQLSLVEDVVFEYDTNFIVSSRYNLYCSWKKVNYSSEYDPTLNTSEFGVISTRDGYEYSFFIQATSEPININENIILLASVLFKGSDLNVLSLQTSDIMDLRLNTAQNYVIDGLNIETVVLNTNTVDVKLTKGSISYLSIFKRFNDLDTAALTFSIPLPAIGGFARYKIGYKLDSIYTSSPNIQKVIVSILPDSTVSGIFIPLYNLSVDTSGVLEGSINDIRTFEPLTRRIPTNKMDILADLASLKPYQNPSPGMNVYVNSGSYYILGNQKTSPKKLVVHDRVLNVGYKRLDVVGYNQDNELLVYKGVETLLSDPDILPTNLPDIFLPVYSVVIEDTTTQLTDPANIYSIERGEIKDLRKILSSDESARNIQVSSLNFSGVVSGGLPNTEANLSAEYLFEAIDSSLVGIKEKFDDIKLIPQDSPSSPVSFNSTNEIIVGHENYTGNNSDRNTRVGINVSRDALNSNKIVIKNSWDNELRLLTTPRPITDMHFHPSDLLSELGSPITVSSLIIEDRDEDRYAFVSDFISSDIPNPTFIYTEAQNNIPAHISLRINPVGGLENTADGVSLLLDKTKGLSVSSDGVFIFINPNSSGLSFFDEGLGNFSLGVSASNGVVVDSSNSVSLNIKSNSGLVIDSTQVAVGRPSDFIDNTKGLGSIGTSPTEKLIVKRVGAINYDPSGNLELVHNGDALDKVSYLTEYVSSSGNTYLAVNVDTTKGLGSSSGKLIAKTGNGIYYDGSGNIALNVSPSQFSFSSSQLTFNTSSLVDGNSGITTSLGYLALKLEPSKALSVGSLGLAIDVVDPIFHSISGLGVRLEGVNPTLYVNSSQSNSLAVKLDPSGGLETGANGIRISNSTNSTTKLFIFGGSKQLDSGNLITSDSLAVFDPVFDSTIYKNITPVFDLRESESHASFVLGVLETSPVLHIVGGYSVLGSSFKGHISINLLTNVVNTVSSAECANVADGASFRYNSTRGVVIGGDRHSVNPVENVLIYKPEVSSWVTVSNITAIPSKSIGMSGDLINPVTAAICNFFDPYTSLYYNQIQYVHFVGDLSCSVSSAVSISNYVSNTPVSNSSLNSIGTDEVMVTGGGDYGNGIHLRLNQYIDFTTESATTKCYLPVSGLYKFGSSSIGTSIYVFGGVTSFDNPAKDVLKYDLTSDTWKAVGHSLVNHSMSVDKAF